MPRAHSEFKSPTHRPALREQNAHFFCHSCARALDRGSSKAFFLTNQSSRRRGHDDALRVVRARDGGCTEMQRTRQVRPDGRVCRGAVTRETSVPVQRRGHTKLATGTHRDVRVKPGLD